MDNEIVQTFEQWEQSVFSLGLFNTIIFAGIVAGVVFVAIKIINKAINKGVKGNSVFARKLIDSIIIIIAVVAVLTTITPLKEFGTSILASSGIAAVVVGLAAQEALGNVFSGFSIGISKPFQPGEFIELVDIKVSGIVEEISLRHTVIKDMDNKRIIVPNSVINKDVLRVSKDADSKNCNYLTVAISYNSNIDEAIKIIEEEAGKHPLTIDARTPQQIEDGVHKILVRVNNLGEYSIELKAMIWTKDVMTGFAVLSDIRKAVKSRFDAAGIEIPYPYHNIIMKDNENGK